MNKSKNWWPLNTHGNHDEALYSRQHLCKIGRRDQVTVKIITRQVYCSEKLFSEDAMQPCTSWGSTGE